MGTLDQLTIGQVLSYARDFTIAGTLATVIWKFRGVWDACKNFVARIEKHMDVMEDGMHTMLDNHMTHIERDLRKLAGTEDADVEIPKNSGNGS